MAKKRKKNLSKKQTFFLGVFVGAAALWLPLDTEFSPVHFSKNPWGNVFSEHLPITSPIIKRKGYVLAYDAKCRNPHWVYHKRTQNTSNPQIKRVDLHFQEDPSIPKHLRASKSDYEASGFDRGHLFPAADSNNQEIMEESFFLSNIAPQIPEFNRGYWKKMENHIRKLSEEYETVHIFTGPLYLKIEEKGKSYIKYQVIGQHEVAVPTHFFSLLFVETKGKQMMSKGYIIPNQAIAPNTPLKNFAASIEEIEKSSGVLFTQILDDVTLSPSLN